MKMVNRMIIFLLLSMILLTACGKDELTPANVQAETDTCAVCNMAVADDQHATQVIMESGKTHMFDDIGCMYEFFNENNEEIKGSFVRDYNTKEWIELEEAVFVYDQNVKTPMDIMSFLSVKIRCGSLRKENQGALMKADLDKHDWPVMKNEKMLNGAWTSCGLDERWIKMKKMSIN